MKKVLLLFFPLLFTSAFSQESIRLRSVLPYPVQLSNVWGYADSLGNEYALVGLFDGMSIVDVTNPDSVNELFHVPGPNGIWREIKTWKKYAYATNESKDGLLIVNISMLPDSVDYSYWTADTSLGSAHTLFIDENGILYLFGYNDVNRNIPYNERGALICDLNPSPENPVVVGQYNSDYVHDGFARGDTLWASQISAGNFAVIDVSDKANPVVLATQETPNRFTHNCWLSADGNELFTTDERANSFVASYDVSDIGNITELDRYQAAPGSLLIPHNTYFLNNYLYTAYYKYGMNIVDATEPDNLVEVGYYDTSPFPNSDGFSGCWGVYPFLPSGTILASDMETGLYVLTADLKRACYLVGNITDEQHGNPVNDVTVEIMTTNSIKKSDLLGNYKTGVAAPGTYDVRFYKQECLPRIITGIELEEGITDTLNVVLTCTTFTNIDDVEITGGRIVASPSVFENQTTLYYRLPGNETATLQIFDYSGKMLNQILVTDYEGEIIAGGAMSKGIYLVRLSSGSVSSVIKVLKK